MKAGGGKRKGGKFEREVCKELSLWISGGDDEGLFWRSAMSGGRATVAAKDGRLLSRQAGDLSPLDELANVFLGKFLVECKHHHDLEIKQLICKQAGVLVDWWETARKVGIVHSRHPLLVAKGDMMPTLLGMTWTGQQALREYVAKRGSKWVASGLVWIPSLDLGLVPWQSILDVPIGKRVIRRVALVEPNATKHLPGLPGSL